LSAALVIGAGIGLQREVTHKSAGVLTHMLVALGTALLVVVCSDARSAAPTAVVVPGLALLEALLKPTHQGEHDRSEREGDQRGGDLAEPGGGRGQPDAGRGRQAVDLVLRRQLEDRAAAEKPMPVTMPWMTRDR
jgi:MgtC family protein